MGIKSKNECKCNASKIKSKHKGVFTKERMLRKLEQRRAQKAMMQAQVTSTSTSKL